MAWPVTVDVPVAGLRIRSLRITERLSELFEGDVVLESDGKASCLAVKLEDLVGHEVGVTVLREDDSERYFHGIVSNAVFDDDDRIRARIVPFAWLLACSTDIRIFQNKSVPDIVTEVFKEYGFEGKIKNSLNGTYAPRVYCTQYRETDLNFVARLLEEEGIYFFFTHEQNKHWLVLADSINAHEPASGCDLLPLLPPSTARTGRPHVRAFSGSKTVVPVKYTVRDYHFAKANQEFKAEKDAPQEHGSKDGEHYDFPGHFGPDGEAAGNKLAALRLEQLQMPYETFRGMAESRGVTCGALLKIEGQPPRDVYNQQYLVTATVISIKAGSYRSGDDSFAMDVAFEAISSKRTFRPEYKTEKPTTDGLHTAVVVGPKGDEIYTDADGRVLVQFHWDRLGKKDDKSSTWLRVSSPSAGAERGWLSLPRIGDEVIVDFLEGDPDWPIITGSVYNSTNKWPFALPDKKNYSGFFSRSTLKGGSVQSKGEGPFGNKAPGDFNRLIFDDTKDTERVEFVARKDMWRNVINDDKAYIGHDRISKVDNDETMEVVKNRSRKVGENEKLEIGKNQDLKVGENQTFKIGKKLLIDVGDEIEIRTGQSKLVMKKDGTITLDGKDFTFKATMNTKFEAGMNADFKAGLNSKFEAGLNADFKAGLNFKADGGVMLDMKGGVSAKVAGGAMLDLKGGGMTMLKGGIVMIN